MYSINMILSLMQLFKIMSGEGEQIESPNAGGLFDDSEKCNECSNYPEMADIAIVASLHSSSGIDTSVLPPVAHSLYGLSANAFDAIVRAWMSELPVTAEIIHFGRKVLAAGGRQAAYRAATDKGDSDVQSVDGAAYKVWREFDRLRGLLRFSPNADGEYTALCEPDHFVLPALGPHFRERFGQTPWAIIDVKRCLSLRCKNGQAPVLSDAGDCPEITGKRQDGEWENLWRHYHKTINNESRNNAKLQMQFMPGRYRKYLTEF